MNHKRNVNYWSNYSGGFIWICQGACPKVQLREDDLPQVLCSPPCSLDQESQTPFVAVCLRCLPCLQPFSTETSAQTTSTECCWEQVVYYWYVNIPKLNGDSSFSHPYAVWGTPVKGFVALVSSIFYTQLPSSGSVGPERLVPWTAARRSAATPTSCAPRRSWSNLAGEFVLGRYEGFCDVLGSERSKELLEYLKCTS